MNGMTVHWLMWRLANECDDRPTLTCDGTGDLQFEARCGDVVYRAATPELALLAMLTYVRSTSRQLEHLVVSTGVTLPCPTCGGDGFVSTEDRHVETAKEVCPTCRGALVVPANTGTTREGSCDPETGRPFGEAAS